MNGQRFDGFTRSLGAGLSRRRALRWFGGSLAGAALVTARPPQRAEAQLSCTDVCVLQLKAPRHQCQIACRQCDEKYRPVCYPNEHAASNPHGANPAVICCPHDKPCTRVCGDETSGPGPL